MTAEQRVAFTCWSNDPQRIGEEGQCGVIYGRLFPTEKLARRYYNPDAPERELDSFRTLGIRESDFLP